LDVAVNGPVSFENAFEYVRIWNALFWKLKIKFTANYFSVLMVIARAQGYKNNGGTY
jgi:hypothetical protein